MNRKRTESSYFERKSILEQVGTCIEGHSYKKRRKSSKNLIQKYAQNRSPRFMSQKCSEGSSSYICWKIGHLEGLNPFLLKSLFGEVIFEHVQNGSPKSCGSKKWVKKCRDQKFITIIFYWLKVLYLMIKKNFWFTIQI